MQCFCYVVGFDEPIFVVVFLLYEVCVVIGLDVVDFPTVMCKVLSEMSCAFSSMMIFDVSAYGETLLHAVDHDVDAELASNAVSGDTCSVVTHVV